MSPLTFFAWAGSLLLGGVFLHTATTNAICMWRGIVLKQKGPSITPIAGGVLGYAGLWLSPVDFISNYAWLALILDLGCAPYLLVAIPGILIGLWQTSRFNLVREYTSLNCTDGKVTLRLYKNHTYQAQKDYHRSRGELGLIQVRTGGQWRIQNDELLLEERNPNVEERNQSTGAIRLRTCDDRRLDWISGQKESIVDRLSFCRR